jgi:hypothetical protein
MPAQRNQRSTRPATTTKAGRTTARPGNGGNGPRNGGNDPRPGAGFWPVMLGLSADVELMVEGNDGDAIGFGVCNTCGSLVPGSEISQALHARWHETVAGIESRTAR